ncbi:ABC transporter ATP-binding protein [Paenibacillus zanthoxyli]|uniref:ABC transporter ATP-binding protein n=1 Tax=Paenibacillus zanthoxyli TaxID=369399 RepID=UPI00046EA3E7|nr:ABC transporter ATP-binding protein [Paenibacillus zanthoxyli]
MALASLTDVVKRYDSKLTVDHVNLSINEGEIFGLLGPNGAGKSTTISMLCGLLKMDGGSIVIDGISVAKQPLEAKKRIGLVPQDLALYEDLTTWENASFFGKLYGLRGELLKERVKEALEFTGLADRAKDKPSTFSGGMKRRLNIACAIMHRPKLIIMDEPTVGIDPQSRNHILESVKALNKLGSTVIYTSHYMEEVEAICDRVAIMDKGHIIACGTEKELRERVAHEEKIIIKAGSITPDLILELKQHPRVTRVEAEGETLELYLPSSQSELQDILFIFAKHGGVIQMLQIEQPDLETLFLSLTGRTLRD